MTDVVECTREFLDLLLHDHREAYEKISQVGEGMRLRIRYGPDRFTVAFTGDGVLVKDGVSGNAKSYLSCEIEPDTFFSMLDARTTLSEMVWSDSLDIRGSAEEILRIYQMMELALAASRGSPEFTKLLSKLRDSGRR